MEKTLYLECYSGISGDMTAAALLDLGGDLKALEEVLESLPVSGFRVETGRVKKSGIDACDFRVLLDAAHENHDHDMEYLHGHSMEQTKEHSCVQEDSDEYSHEHSCAFHMHSHTHVHSHEHRGMKEIRQILEQGSMTDRARNMALSIFEILARAEAKAHQVPVDEVHFHEVGAVDSIVDIVSAAVLFDQLDVTQVIVPKLCEGTGTVRCQHGILPVPVPAVANIIQDCGLNLEITDVKGELVTPTGAAIAAALRTSDRLPEEFRISRIGIGAGKRQYECPGILRAMLLETPDSSEDTVIKMEANIDDCSGEILGYVQEELMKAGARDVHYMPAYMKKNRPAWVLNVICKKEEQDKLLEIIFRETTTIGVRYVEMERAVLDRKPCTVSTPYGEVKGKISYFEGKERFSPEYESLAKMARETGKPLMELYRMAEQKWAE